MQLLKDLKWVTLYARHTAWHVFISVWFICYSLNYNLYFLPMSETVRCSGSVSWPGTFAIGVVLKSVFRSESGVTLEHMSDIKTTFRKEKTPILCIIRQRKCMVISLRQIELKKVLRIPFYTFIRHKRNGLG